MLSDIQGVGDEEVKETKKFPDIAGD